MKELNGSTVEAGWFEEQGLHTQAGISYTALAELHFSGGDGRFPKRDILGLSSFLFPPQNDSNMLRVFKKWMANPDKISLNDLLDNIGKRQAINIKNAFGRSELGVTKNPTPLIDTGEWRKKTAYKTSKDNTAKTTRGGKRY